MKFRIDENLPVEIAQALRSVGHDAATVGEESLSGSADPTLRSICRLEDRTLVTLDTHFADIRVIPP
jgi:predicted nuclease of predicted toxin-antitoxin system